MIYFYSPLISHNIQKLHNYLDHFYKKLFSNATPVFDATILLDGEFQLIVLNYQTQILDKMIQIFNCYKKLSQPEKLIIQNAYTNNNNIEGICNGSCDPIKYDGLPDGIKTAVKSLYDNLLAVKRGEKRETC
ncbi:MAG: hypothetical protein H7Y31_06650 [Chitinophagaceae bacterium]|nr:hypothetical protein [Chitinophagaceae bacterium]